MEECSKSMATKNHRFCVIIEVFANITACMVFTVNCALADTWLKKLKMALSTKKPSQYKVESSA